MRALRSHDSFNVFFFSKVYCQPFEAGDYIVYLLRMAGGGAAIGTAFGLAIVRCLGRMKRKDHKDAVGQITMPVNFWQNTFSDRTRCIAQLPYGPDPHFR